MLQYPARYLAEGQHSNLAVDPETGLPEKGHHAGDMGFRYNATYNIETTGTINMVNSLAALKSWSMKRKKIQLGGDETGA